MIQNITTAAHPFADPAMKALRELRIHLELRSKELFLEVRHYPTPIARCDDQLPKILEQRTHAVRQLGKICEAKTKATQPQRRSPLPALRALTGHYPRSDDDTEMALLARLEETLSERVAAERQSKNPANT